jgi:hypothetical protein
VAEFRGGPSAAARESAARHFYLWATHTAFRSSTTCMALNGGGYFFWKRRGRKECRRKINYSVLAAEFSFFIGFDILLHS